MRSLRSAFSALSLSFFSLSAITGCTQADTDTDTDAEETAPLGEASQAIASDPSLSAPYGYCASTHVWNGIHGDIRYPANGNCNASVYSPLVVLFHAYGDDYGYDTYDYLLEHLAQNGFIAVSIDVIGADSANHAAAVESATGYLESLWTDWPKSVYIDPSRVALIGHSRGGGTARHLADALKGNADRWTVRAIVSLAGVNSNELDVTRAMAPAFLAVHAADDEDEAAANSFSLYDKAGTEGSITWASADAMYKSMKLLENGSHGAFSEGAGNNPSDQANVAKGYVLAFLAAHMQNNMTWYEDYIRKDNVPHGWPGGVVVSQVTDGFLRRVIDNFDDGSIDVATNGENVLVVSAGSGVIDLDAATDSPHKTHAFNLFGMNESAFVRWTVPAGQRNLDGFKYLSFRIGQTSGAPANDLRVQIRNGMTWSPEVRVTDHGTIPMPMEMCVAGLQWCISYEVLDHMGTVRVPLSAFGAHNDVVYVRFLTRGDSDWKTFLVDNLEFAESVLKP